MGKSWDEMDVDDALPMEGSLFGDDSFNSGGSEEIDLFSEDNDLFSESSFPMGNVNISSPKVRKLSAGRIVGMVFMGLLMSGLLFLCVFGLYTRFIRFPDERERVWEHSRLYALQNFSDDVNVMNVGIKDSYLMRELPYANGNSDREKFMEYVVGTVSYSSDVVNKKNVFGNDLIDPDTMLILTEDSWIEDGEDAYIHYIDYTAIEFDTDTIKQLVRENELTSDDIDYRNKLTDMFCQYIYGIDVEELPLVSIPREPNMVWNGAGYDVILAEDIYIDKALFSSPELYDCFERFAQAIAKQVGLKLTTSEEYRAWDKLSDANKEDTVAPLKYGKYSINHIWCGAYYLLNEYESSEFQGGVSPQLGDGSKDQPASIGTPVITYILRYDEEGNLEKLPIRVTLREFGVSQAAIDWFQAKNVQNRGYDVTSELQYCYYVFEVTNLSKETIVIYDNTSLCDGNANCSARTGTIYGLQSSVELAPEETGIIESWGRSTELNLKYVIWGADFARRENPVWFRVLAGDLEDPTWEKGVYINDTRG